MWTPQLLIIGRVYCTVLRAQVRNHQVGRHFKQPKVCLFQGWHYWSMSPYDVAYPHDSQTGRRNCDDLPCDYHHFRGKFQLAKNRDHPNLVNEVIHIFDDFLYNEKYQQECPFGKNTIYHHLPVKGVSSNPSINQPTNGKKTSMNIKIFKKTWRSIAVFLATGWNWNDLAMSKNLGTLR